MTINKTNYTHFLNLKDQLCLLEFRGINDYYFNNWTKPVGSARNQAPIWSNKKLVKIELNLELGGKNTFLNVPIF